MACGGTNIERIGMSTKQIDSIVIFEGMQPTASIGRDQRW